LPGYDEERQRTFRDVPSESNVYTKAEYTARWQSRREPNRRLSADVFEAVSAAAAHTACTIALGQSFVDSGDASSFVGLGSFGIGDEDQTARWTQNDSAGTAVHVEGTAFRRRTVCVVLIMYGPQGQLAPNETVHIGGVDVTAVDVSVEELE